MIFFFFFFGHRQLDVWKYFHLKVQDNFHFFGLNLSCFSPVFSVFSTLGCCGPVTLAAEDCLGFLPFPLLLLNSVVCSSRTHLTSVPLYPSVSLHCLKPPSHFPLCFTQTWTPDDGILGPAWQGDTHLLSSVGVSHTPSSHAPQPSTLPAVGRVHSCFPRSCGVPITQPSAETVPSSSRACWSRVTNFISVSISIL